MRTPIPLDLRGTLAGGGIRRARRRDRRIRRRPTATASRGFKALCTFRGLSIVQAAPGIDEVDGVAAEDGYPSFIETSFANDPNPYTSDQGASYGALFCTFGATSARCWFEDIAGAVPDSFSLGTAFAADDADRTTAAPTDTPIEASTPQGSDPFTAPRATGGGGGGWWLILAALGALACRNRYRQRGRTWPRAVPPAGQGAPGRRS